MFIQETGVGNSQLLQVDVAVPLLRMVGSQRIFTRRGAPYIAKDDGAVSFSEGKLSKKGVVGHSTHEKQVWVQKSSSGS
ncbi:regulator of nonsense transcripts UPF3-like [Trifolium medium]|uniref:Regulator of nonsense transcripts UPF3-like n=1 Tax=Trifolium medium TaxID=97028 RepID=A0A392MN35_9FABA|nr:regulator of nonsense transcripts UPF3-like [Trifolium medium]